MRHAAAYMYGHPTWPIPPASIDAASVSSRTPTPAQFNVVVTAVRTQPLPNPRPWPLLTELTAPHGQRPTSNTEQVEDTVPWW
jgi:hypothetical protein